MTSFWIFIKEFSLFGIIEKRGGGVRTFFWRSMGTVNTSRTVLRTFCEVHDQPQNFAFWPQFPCKIPMKLNRWKHWRLSRNVWHNTGQWDQKTTRQMQNRQCCVTLVSVDNVVRCNLLTLRRPNLNIWPSNRNSFLTPSTSSVTKVAY